MLLAIDIGNTLTKLGVFDNETLACQFNIPTKRTDTAAGIFQPQLTQKVHAVIVSSVVPELENVYREFTRQYFSLEPIFVNSSSDFGLRINYFPAKNLGVDRLVTAFAAIEKFRETCIVCDFGTATTIDVVTARREFLGGIIAPGMRLMSESLRLKTAQLPQIEIEKPARVIGDSTGTAIQSGIYFGYVGLVDGIIERMKNEIGEKPKTLATGGFARLLAESSSQIDVVDDGLMLEGLRLLYEKRFR